MGAALELFAAVLILVRRTQDGDDLLLGGKGNGARNLGARALGGFHNALGAAINQVVLIRLELDADFLVGHLFSSYFYRSRGQRGEHPFTRASAQSEAANGESL